VTLAWSANEEENPLEALKERIKVFGGYKACPE